MKHKVLAGLVAAGVLGIAGTALADVNINVNIDNLPKYAANTQSRPQPPEFKKGERPQMPSQSERSFDRKPPEFDGKKPPMSGDRRMPPPDGAHSPDKRPPMPKKK